VNKSLVKSLIALGVMAASANALAVQVYLSEDHLRAGASPTSAGTYYTLISNGSDQAAANGVSAEYVASGGGASTATWDWSGGVLTQTGGTLWSNQWIGSSPLSGSMIVGDKVTGLVLDTNTGTTTASSYRCNEGNFTPGVGGSGCGNYAFGLNAADDSTRLYNVGGNADCDNIIIGGDDVGPPGVHRGLRNWAGGGANGCGDNSQRGARDMTNIIQDNTGSGGSLVLANSYLPGGAFDARCFDSTKTGGALFTAGVADCGRAHWMVFQLTPVPVPAAAWLFGSAFGLLGLSRRRKV
jgi:hypothetical protein